MQGVIIFDFDAGEVITPSTPPDTQKADLKACADAMRADNRAEFIRLLDKCRDRLDEPLESGRCLIHYATGTKDIFYLKSLVEAGANVDVRSMDTGLQSSLDVAIGSSALVYAVFNGSSEHVDYLISKKANTECHDEKGRSLIFTCLLLFTPLYASGAKRTEKLEALRHLLPHIDLTQRDENMKTVMTYAMTRATPAVVMCLKESGCPVLVEDVAYAIAEGFFSTAQVLTEGGFALSSLQEVKEIEKAVEKVRGKKSDKDFSPLFNLLSPFQMNTDASATFGQELVADFHRRFESSIGRVYSGGDKPLPLPKMRR